MKHCSNNLCVTENPQPLTNFYKNVTGKDGLMSQCKNCKCKATYKWNKANKHLHTEYKKRWKMKNPIKDRFAHLKRRYGITGDDYLKMQAKQDNKCAICSLEPENIGLAVDHNHVTGKVRGLLCYTCNTGLGAFKDNVNFLKNAISYLEENDK